MENTDWIAHLRLRNAHSVTDGIITDAQIASVAQERGIGAVALLNQNHLIDVVAFWRKLSSAAIHPIVGSSALVRVGENCVGEIGLLAMNRTGYSQLCRLSPLLWNQDEPIDLDRLLEAQTDQLAVLTGAQDTGLTASFSRGDLTESGQVRVMDRLAKTFADRLHIEISRSGGADNRLEALLYTIAEKYSLPLVATGNVCCLNPQDSELVSVRQKIARPDLDTPQMRGGHLLSKAQMHNQFADIPAAVENARNLALGCVLEFAQTKPMFPVPRSIAEVSSGETITPEHLHEQLVDRARKGALTRLQEQKTKSKTGKITQLPKKYAQRLDMELEVLGSKGFAGYFLIVEEILVQARQQGILVGPGRVRRPAL